MSKHSTITAIWWIKRDMRLIDNAALFNAIKAHETVLPVFIWEPELISAPETSEFHTHAWFQALQNLRLELEKRGLSLYEIHSNAIEGFANLKHTFNFTHMYSHEEIGSNITYNRDKQVQKWCKENNVQWLEFWQTGVVRGLQERTDWQKQWNDRILETEILPVAIPKPLPEDIVQSCKLTKNTTYSSAVLDKVLQPCSELDGMKTLDSFLEDRSRYYSGGISSPNRAFRHGSRLSTHLAWGTISSKVVYQRTQRALKALPKDQNNKQWRRSLHSFSSRMHWRDHFMQRLESATWMEYSALNPVYNAVEYTNKPEMLHAWLFGNTGYPLVDACMRCLQNTGFLNFRMRSMITSFACHALHLSWQEIMYPLACLFRDYEPGIHISQLQMQAGVVGINTIRVYSPQKQLLDQDPKCIFVKQWLPELQNSSTAAIVSHIEVPISGYSKPIIDWKTSTTAMKEQLFSIKKTQEARIASKEVLHKHGSKQKKFTKKKKIQKKDDQMQLL